MTEAPMRSLPYRSTRRSPGSGRFLCRTHRVVSGAGYPSAELVMTFRSSERWVALATDHIALTEVSERLTSERIVASARATPRQQQAGRDLWSQPARR